MLSLHSSAFTHDAEIPKKYTCDGIGISPPLEWTGVPETTQSLVLIVDDPEAPDPEAPRMTWVHWLVYNIPPNIQSLPEGASSGGLPEGAIQGRNDWKKSAYGGACPPRGRHHYFHKLYALDTVLSGLHNPDKAALEAAMRGHVLAEAELIGTYQK